RAIADHLAAPMVEIEHRGEAEVDADREQFAADDAADARGLPAGGDRVAIPGPAESRHGRDPREAVDQPLDPAAFLVDADQQAGPDPAHPGDEPGDLRPA